MPLSSGASAGGADVRRGERADGSARVTAREGWSAEALRRDRRGRGQIERGDTPQLAGVLRILERRRAVHGAAVVPDDEITDTPVVAVDEVALLGVLDEIAQQQASLGHGPVDDARRM